MSGHLFLRRTVLAADAGSVLGVRLLVSAVAVVALSMTSPAPGLIIDVFDTYQSVRLGAQNTVTGSMLGGARNMQVAGTADASALVSNGELLFSQSATGQAEVVAGYYGTTGLGHIDLTGGGADTAFKIRVNGSALSGILVVSVSSDYAPINTNSRLLVPVLPTGSPVDYLLPYANFYKPPGFSGPADFASVQRVSFYFQTVAQSAPGWISIDSFSTVPEPCSALLFSLLPVGVCQARLARLMRRSTWLAGDKGCVTHPRRGEDGGTMMKDERVAPARPIVA